MNPPLILRDVVSAPADKPYRVYRQPRRVRGDGSIPWDTAGAATASKPPRKQGERRNRIGWRLFRYSRRLLYVVILGAVVWSGVAYWSFRGAVKDSNDRVPDKVMRALSPANGPIMTTPINILVLGSDTRGKGDTGRSDSMILMRVDIPRRRVAMLSIPRDLRVPIKGYGDEKVNAAYSLGGPALTIDTLHSLTGVDINHYAEINFRGFRQLINAVGGIYLVNPHAIRSNKFDGQVWRFKKGELHLNGRRALAYSRVRENLLNPNDSDFTRGARQQQVIDSVVHKLASVDSVLHPRRNPRAAIKPITTDITESQIMALAFGKTWAKHTVHCRLGGDIDMVGGQSVIRGDGEANRAVVRMWEGTGQPVEPKLTA
ncbi:MAG: LCP family protein, partial [Thermoleophilia bacterium]|nr:LCP family protein [Thermoleophilia bacterium]